MTKYKVVKEFGSAQKGDLLTCNEHGNYSFEYTTDNSSRYMELDAETADSFVGEGYLFKLEDEAVCESCSKLNKVLSFCEDKLSAYDNDYNAMMDKYNEGEVPTCVKVEAETVYYNMSKLLDEIKNLINE